jgi:hypothetical protein
MAFVLGMAKALNRIGRLQQAIDELGTLPRKVAETVAPQISKLITRQFTTGTDPYGRRWQPVTKSTLARRVSGRKGPPLNDTARAKAGTLAKLMPGGRKGVRIVLGRPELYFSQVGTRTQPVRKVFPDRGIPAAWREIMSKAAKSEFRRIMRRAK